MNHCTLKDIEFNFLLGENLEFSIESFCPLTTTNLTKKQKRKREERREALY